MVLFDDRNLNKSTPDKTDNRRPREHASSDVGEVGEAEDDQRLKDPHLVHGQPDQHKIISLTRYTKIIMLKS